MLQRLGALAALSLAVIPVVRHLDWARDRAGTLRVAEEQRIQAHFPEAAERIETAESGTWARVHLARILVNQTFDTRWLLELPPAEAERELARAESRLRLAHDLAVAALREQPTNAAAATLIGASTFRRWLGAGDPKLIESPSGWEAPLRAAVEMAPGDAEPLRALTTGYLSIWGSLSPEKQREVEPIIRRAFGDETTFLQLAELWLSVAPSRDVALAFVPDTADAWQVVLSVFSRRGDWRDYAEARVRWDSALLRRLEERQREAEENVRAGTVIKARRLSTGVLLASRPDARYAPLLTRTLEQLPPGVADPRHARRLSQLLDWVLDEWVRGSPPISPTAVARLAAVAGEIPPPRAALAALAAGDLTEAELQERRFGAPGTDAWGRYTVVKARVLAERGRAREGLTLLEGLGRHWRGRPEALLARHAVAAAAQDAAAVEAAEKALSTLGDSKWAPTEWVFAGRLAHVSLVPATEARRLEIALDGVPAPGGVVEVRWDGRLAAVRAVAPGASVRLELPITRGPHLLEIETVAGGRVRPGSVTLL